MPTNPNRCPCGYIGYSDIPADALGLECWICGVELRRPPRLTASYVWGQESAFRVAGLEDSLQASIRAALEASHQ